MLVSRIGRRVSMLVETNGWGQRFSHHHQRTSAAAVTAAPPRVRADVQPQDLPSVIVKSSSDSPTAKPAAPIQSTVPDAVWRRSGMKITTAIITTSTKAVTNQNAWW